ncbi:Gamma-glutamyltranspeptidase [Drechslerella dactyloides]|uniref:Glutathione hydrolase n=1 Tax=Drechslerella dactyloides TaxID=74499 RepID=A0AAD6J6G8_DREDA|nr:Gamma-glutamyltranspeptidase [Drechslerella dactyloides]
MELSPNEPETALELLAVSQQARVFTSTLACLGARRGVLFANMKSIIAAFLLAALQSAPVSGFPAALQGRHHEKDHRGAVASETDVCSKVGIDLLRRGGNAADAMVGTAICVGTVGMYHTGIGGGGFMLIRSPKGEYEYVDFREMAPGASCEDMFVNKTELSLYGGLASGVPGELRGLEYLHKKYGKLPWKRTIEPSIKLARNGFKVNGDHVKLFALAQEMAGNNFLTEQPTWAIDFAPNGTLVGLGDTMYRKRFADTLETIANRGADAFYTGPIANATVQGLKETGGIMTLDDLQRYKVAIRDTTSITYHGYRFHGTTAPSSGAVTQAVFKILEGYDISAKANTNESTHLILEAMRFGYAMRAELGDPNFLPNMTAYQANMISDETALLVREKISPQTTLNVSDYNPKGLESLDTPGTSHMAVADNSGLAISLTSTLNLLFGSSVMIPETGIIMNNQMNDFSIPGSSNAFGYIPAPSNFIRPYKRPLSSTTPHIIERPDGQLYLVVGAAGGSKIISSTIQNIHNMLDLGDSAPQALARPRFHDQLTPNVCNVEWTYDNSTLAYLRERNHTVAIVAPGIASAQAVRMLPNGTFEAAGEPRQFNSGGYAI